MTLLSFRINQMKKNTKINVSFPLVQQMRISVAKLPKFERKMQWAGLSRIVYPFLNHSVRHNRCRSQMRGAYILTLELWRPHSSHHNPESIRKMSAAPRTRKKLNQSNRHENNYGIIINDLCNNRFSKIMVFSRFMVAEGFQ